jgi:iron complex outermembrane receptor protein
MKRILLGSLFSLMIVHANAMVSQPDTIGLDEVVVTGNRIEVNRLNTPVSVTVVTQTDIRAQEESNILPVVTRVTPGLFISEIGTAGYALGNGTSGQLTIRGIGGSPNAQVLMMVDGQPQYMGVFGHPLPNFHMSSNVERVEVVRGPASLLYGSNAMGGVINVITRKQQQDGLTWSANGAWGSFSTQKYSASAGYKKNRLTAGVSFHHDRTAGHRDTSAFSITNLNVYAGYEINPNWQAKASFMMADYSFEDPGSEADPFSVAFLGDISRRMASVSVKNRYDKSQGGIFAYYNWGHHSFSDGWESDDVNSGVNLYQAVNTWKGGTLTAGADFKYYGGIGKFGFLADTFLTVTETAGYLVVDQEIGNVLNINAGVRYEAHSMYGGEPVPQAGFTVKPLKGTAIKGLVSKGFRNPTIMELYLFAPNDQLGPERLWNYEISYMQRLGSLGRVEVTGYMIDANDLIVMQPRTTPGPPMTRANVGSVSNWGIEVESTVTPSEGLKIDANYSYLNSDTKLYFAPEHQFYLGATYRIGDITAAVNLKTVSGLYTLISSEDPVNDVNESYALLNAKVMYQPLDFLEVFIAGRNLMNQDYQTVFGYPMPGINFIGGVGLRF